MSMKQIGHRLREIGMLCRGLLKPEEYLTIY